uniref:Uncharacterized protein n=1 Tax=Zea mays TaxID=4577 RepID=A0A804QNF3_MAIZE
MASAKQSKKMRILLIPFFATSHIGPYIDFAVRLAAARPGAVEPTVAVTPANVAVVRSALERHGPAASGTVRIVTYPFPRVDGLAPGVENLSTAGDDAWRIDAAAIDEALSRPAQEALLRERSPDAVVSDYHFFWTSSIAAELGLPAGDTDPRQRAAGVPETPGEGPRHVQPLQRGAGQVFGRRLQHVRRHGAGVPRGERARQILEALLLRRPRLTAAAGGSGRHQRVSMHQVARLQAKLLGGVRVLRHLRRHLGGPAPGAGARPGGLRGAVPVGGEGRRVDAAGGLGAARRGEGDAGERVGSADGGAGPSSGGRVPDALRVELVAGGGGGRRADADVAAGVRPVHRGEAGDGRARDRGAGLEWGAEHEVRGEGARAGGGGGSGGGEVLGARRAGGGGEGQGAGSRSEGPRCRSGGRLVVP